MGRKSYLGNCNWTSSGIIQILRNERHCGDVLTRKTWTPDFHDHKSVKNRGKRPQSLYRKHHEGIVSREDYVAVQHMLDNAKYRNKAFLPELKVISTGVLKGFVIVHPRWAGFTAADYIQASQSVYKDEQEEQHESEYKVEVEAGDFDMRGFEITRQEFFDSVSKPMIVFANDSFRVSQNIADNLENCNFVELLINPVERKFAIRTTNQENKLGVFVSRRTPGKYSPKTVPAAAYMKTLYGLLNWNIDYKYRVIGCKYGNEKEHTYIFDIRDSEAYMHACSIPIEEQEGKCTSNTIHITQSRNRIRAIPEEWTNSFGKPYYLHEMTAQMLQSQSEKDWLTRLEGKMYETGRRMNVTPFEELKSYITKELNGITIEEIENEQQ